MTRSTLKQYAVTVAGSLALALVLTGCQGDSAAPAPLDSPSSEESPATADPTPSPSDSAPGGSETDAGPPTLPAEAKGTTRASAGPFVRYWVDTFNYATQALDPTALQRISGKTCEACLEIEQIIRRIKAQDGFMRGASWHLRRTQLLPPSEPRKPQVRAFITFAPSVVLERKGDQPKRFEGGDRTVYTFNLVTKQDGWIVSGIVGVTA